MAPEGVVETSFGTINDDETGNTKTLVFQWALWDAVTYTFPDFKQVVLVNESTGMCH